MNTILVACALVLVVWLGGSAQAEPNRVSGCGFGTFPPCIITEAKPDPIEVILVPSQCECRMAAAMAAMHVWIYRNGKQPTIPRPEYYYTETLPLWDKARRECGKDGQ